MKTNKASNPKTSTLTRVSLITMFLLFSASLLSHAQINFSGEWTYDKTKSTPGTNNSVYPGTITREIKQTVSTFTYRDIYAQNGAEPYIGSDIVLNLDGKEEIDKSDPDFTITKSLKWLQDKKSFIITFRTKYTVDGVMKEILINETYTLSENGKTLTIVEFHKAELGEKTSTNIYHIK